jgi:PEP-CTERM motif
LTLGLRDGASGQAGQLVFGGRFSGQIDTGEPGIPVTPPPVPAGLTNEFLGPTMQELHLGDHVFSVSVGPVVWPHLTYTGDDSEFFHTVPGDEGQIGARIEVSDAPNTPEPATLLMAGLGLAGVGVTAWRRRRAARS